MSFKTGTHNTYFLYLAIASHIIWRSFLFLFLRWFLSSGSGWKTHTGMSPLMPSLSLCSLLPSLDSSLYPSSYCSFFFLILLTPSIIAVGQWIEEDTDLTRTGAESLGEVISPKIHSLAGWPLPFHPLDFRCSCLDGPCKTLTRSVKTADVWWQWL